MRYNRLPGIKSRESENQYYLSIVADEDGHLWMLTYDNGIWKNDGNNLVHYPLKDGNKEVKLLSIYKDNQGDFWLGTAQSGVFKFNGESFEKFEP